MADRHSRPSSTGVVIAILLFAPAALLGSMTASAAGLKIERINIESTPAGAEVRTIVGRHGFTPLSITERDIYPNTYPDEKLELYGKVIISKPGCSTVTRAVTLDDIKHGLDVQLDCMEATAAVKPATAGKKRTKTKTKKKTKTKTKAKKETNQKARQPATSTAEPLSERRLRQLKVLNELLEDSLVTADEERTIRKRIFERLNQ